MIYTMLYFLKTCYSTDNVLDLTKGIPEFLFIFAHFSNGLQIGRMRMFLPRKSVAYI
jgi:hypothetical protein